METSVVRGVHSNGTTYSVTFVYYPPVNYTCICYRNSNNSMTYYTSGNIQLAKTRFAPNLS